MAHNGYAFVDVVGAVAFHFGSVAVGEGLFADDFQFAGFVIIFRFHGGKTVNAGNDVSGVFAQTVQNDAQRRFAHFVGRAGDADGAFRGGETFMAGQEAEAFGFFAQQHGAQIAVAEAHGALVGHRARNAEALQAQADFFGRFGGGFHAGFNGDGRADGVSPDGVVKSDGLDALDDFFHVNAFVQADFARFFQIFNAGFFQSGVDFVNSSFVSFKRNHSHSPGLTLCGGQFS